jgi:hypothetical protein
MAISALFLAFCVFSLIEQLIVLSHLLLTRGQMRSETDGPEGMDRINEKISASVFPEKQEAKLMDPIGPSEHSSTSTSRHSSEVLPAASLGSSNRLLKKWEPPKWITNYMDWHAQVRLTHPAFNSSRESATLPPLLIAYCSRKCGGLHDRLGSLPFDLYLANQTKRLLLYVWENPTALEHFLVPNRLNWTIEGLPKHPQLSNLRKAQNLFDVYKRGDSGTSEVFWKESLPNAIILALNHSIPVFINRLRTHNGEFFLETLLQGLGETDMIHTTPSFGWIWQAIFQPSQGLQGYIDQMRQSMNLTKGHYTAVHCRLHYPAMLKEHAKNVPLQSLHGVGSLDRAGLLLEGPGKEFAVAIGIHAVQCARTLTANDNELLYFFSDANNLVEYMAQTNRSETTHNRTDEFDVDRRAKQVLSQVQLVARPDIHRRNFHLDFHHTTSPHDYYSIFADLYLAMEARCITFGYGGYGRFAQQLSNNACYLQHQLHIHNPFFGHSLNMHRNVCTKESYANLSQLGSSS